MELVMTTAPLLPDAFPSLLAHARNPNGVRNAIEQLEKGISTNSIRNVVLNDAKFVLGSAVYDTWRKVVGEPFFYGGSSTTVTDAERDLYCDMMVSNLHEVIAANKRIERSAAKGAGIDAMRALVKEVLPLSMAVVALKDHVVKGRVVRETPSADLNPNKIVRTCPCCFRPIAVQDGRMVHHGYQRPGLGFQTASCYGIRFKPLERSSEGLVWLVKSTEERLKVLRAAYAQRGDVKELIARVRNAEKPTVVKRGEEGWDRAFRQYVAELEGDIPATQSFLATVQDMLANWKQTEAE